MRSVAFTLLLALLPPRLLSSPRLKGIGGGCGEQLTVNGCFEMGFNIFRRTSINSAGPGLSLRALYPVFSPDNSRCLGNKLLLPAARVSPSSRLHIQIPLRSSSPPRRSPSADAVCAATTALHGAVATVPPSSWFEWASEVGGLPCIEPQLSGADVWPVEERHAVRRALLLVGHGARRQSLEGPTTGAAAHPVVMIPAKRLKNG